jgi:plasmid maintenance system antidote protein VapI
MLDMALRLEGRLGSTAETWLRMQVNYGLAQIRDCVAGMRIKRIEGQAH